MHPVRLISLLLAVLLAGCGRPEGPRETAGRFFDHCIHNKTDAAYAMSTTMFQVEVSQKYFEARVRELGLPKVTAVQWGEPVKRGNLTLVHGDFTRPEGGPLGLSVALAMEGGQWRFFEARLESPTGSGEDVFRVKARTPDGALVNAKGAASFTLPVAPVVPTNAQLEKIVEEVLLKLDAAIKADDFKDFVEFVSDRWKFRGKDPKDIEYFGTNANRLKNSDIDNKDRRLTSAELKRDYQELIKLHTDLSPIKGKKVIWSDVPAMTTDGVLETKGTFENTYCFINTDPPIPKLLSFQINFVFESATWKVFGLSVSLK